MLFYGNIFYGYPQLTHRSYICLYARKTSTKLLNTDNHYIFYGLNTLTIKLINH